MLALIVALLVLPSLAYRETIHLRPTSSNMSCSTQPCYTISEYAQYFHFNGSNLTLQFLPGNHTLNLSLTITDIFQLEILGSVEQTRIVCSPNVGLTFRNITEMKIDGLAFISCARSPVTQTGSGSNTLIPLFYGLYLQSVQNTEINDCTFQDSYGSALWVESSHVFFVKNNYFLGNCRLCLSVDCSYQNAHFCYGGGVFASYGSNLSFTGSNSFIGNSAFSGGGVSVWFSSSVNISGNTTFSDNSVQYGGGVSVWFSSSVNISGNTTFSDNSVQYGGGVSVWFSSSVNISGNTTFSGNSASRHGGGVHARSSSNVNIGGNSMFIGNSARYGGGVSARSSSNVDISGETTFSANSASGNGGGVHAVFNSDVRIDGNTTFIGNSAKYIGGGVFANNKIKVNIGENSTFIGNSALYGGGVQVVRSSSVDIRGTTFSGNSASDNGGAVSASSNSKVNIDENSTFIGNSARYGGGISAFSSCTVNISESITFIHNSARNGGGVYAQDSSSVYINGNVSFNGNSATYGGGVYAQYSSSVNINGNTTFKRNSAASGGGMYIDDSTVDLDGSNCFDNNTAKSEGGAIYARDGLIAFGGNDAFIANTAESKGAAIYTSFTTLLFQGSSSFANNSAQYGGGIYSESSNLTFAHNRSIHNTRKPPSCSCTAVSNSVSFVNNTALRGGAQYLDVYSNFSLHQTTHIYFQDNSVTEFGGAIYVVDVPHRSECFFHILKNQSHDMKTTPLVFVNNSAGVRGGVLFGGLLDKCKFQSDKYKSALQLFNMSIIQGNDEMCHSISSDPTRLCFCNKTEPDCSTVSQSKSIYPGQGVEFSTIAIDQSYSAIPALIHIAMRSGLNVIEIISYEIGENCTSRSRTPKTFTNILELYPTNKTGNASHLFVNIIFEKCPFGFEPSNSTGNCICYHRLWQFINTCDIDKQAILRNASRTFWLGVSYNNGTPEGFIHHPFCPLDYCTRESKYINLNNPDEQCKDNHSGLLCGKCKESLSLVLGSYQCKKCSNSYLALLIPFALAGVLLVILLFLLDLTVKAGTLHGLIFYSNIVAANHHIFIPQSANNPASIFIAWLNLDLGIQTCFYNGMDAYGKTWLDLVFPVYIWIIVGFLVYIRYHSVTVTKLLGSSPVAVLATLFFLSYAKILRTIISALSLTVLHYPNKDVVVWIHDANVSLAKYIPLTLVALLFLLFLFIPYTLLLFLGQWLQRKSHHRLLSWVNNPKLKAVLNTYHAPYKPKQQYWTGLLLLIRCALFFVFAFNSIGDDNINLLVTSLTTSGILIWFSLSGTIYKSWHLNALEVSFILNLGTLAVTTYHMKLSGGSQAAVAYTSLGIAFLTFVGIVICHIYMRIKSKVNYIQWGHQLQHKN